MNCIQWVNTICVLIVMQALVIALDPRHGIVERVGVPVVGLALCVLVQIVARRDAAKR